MGQWLVLVLLWCSSDSEDDLIHGGEWVQAFFFFLFSNFP